MDNQAYKEKIKSNVERMKREYQGGAYFYRVYRFDNSCQNCGLLTPVIGITAEWVKKKRDLWYYNVVVGITEDHCLKDLAIKLGVEGLELITKNESTYLGNICIHCFSPQDDSHIQEEIEFRLEDYFYESEKAEKLNWLKTHCIASFKLPLVLKLLL